MSITIERAGARVYLLGDTYPVKDRIKSIGGHWDGEKKAWWVGAAKVADAEKLAGFVTTAVETEKKVSDDSKVVAKAKYKGRSYFVLWMGRCKSGDEKAHLTVLDGSIEFWAALSECEITKRYAPREYRGRTEYTTLGSLRRFIERVKRDEAKGEESPHKYPRTGCACGSRDGITQDSDCWTCKHDAE